MKSVIRVLTAGVFIGLLIGVALFIAVGLKSSEATGTVTQKFLGVPVLESTKTALAAGGFSAQLRPLPGLLLPLLGPALVLLAAHIIIKSLATRGKGRVAEE